jgi:hypothetical protein
MNGITRLPAILALAASLAACGGSDSGTVVTLVREVANLQCEPPQTTLAQLDAELNSAGVTPSSASCAWDGLARVAQCGAPAPYLRVIEVAESQAGIARGLGYRSPTEFLSVIPIDCPSQ